MTDILQLSKKSLLALAFLLVLALAAVASVPVADAATNCTYYSDASHTTVVGRFGTDCCNNRVAWGVKTQFSECGPGCLPCVPPPR